MFTPYITLHDDAVLRYAGSQCDTDDDSYSGSQPTTDTNTRSSSYDHNSHYGTFVEAAG